MAQKKKALAGVLGQRQLADGIFDLRLKTELAGEAHCGQLNIHKKKQGRTAPPPRPNAQNIPRLRGNAYL